MRERTRLRGGAPRETKIGPCLRENGKRRGAAAQTNFAAPLPMVPVASPGRRAARHREPRTERNRWAQSHARGSVRRSRGSTIARHLAHAPARRPRANAPTLSARRRAVYPFRQSPSPQVHDENGSTHPGASGRRPRGDVERRPRAHRRERAARRRARRPEYTGPESRMIFGFRRASQVGNVIYACGALPDFVNLPPPLDRRGRAAANWRGWASRRVTHP